MKYVAGKDWGHSTRVTGLRCRSRGKNLALAPDVLDVCAVFTNHKTPDSPCTAGSWGLLAE